MTGKYSGPERRKFLRLDYVTPLAVKVCKKETIHKLLEGYTSNVSQNGICCHIKEKVNEGDVLWLSFDRGTLSICQELEKNSLIYQNGIIGKVVRIMHKAEDGFTVGISFITREEKNETYIFPKVHFSMNSDDAEEDEEGTSEVVEPEEEDNLLGGRQNGEP